jgi:hypothetical protein
METWREVFGYVILFVIALFGAPITQLFKNLLSIIFKKVVEAKWALLLSLVVACGVAVLEMWLTGQLTDFVITPQTFPVFASAVFSVAQIYYNLFKQSPTVLGTKSLLKPPTA